MYDLAYWLQVLGAEHVTHYGGKGDPYIKLRDKARRTSDGKLDLTNGPHGPRTVATIDRDVRVPAPLQYITMCFEVETPQQAFRRAAHRRLRAP